jgi:Protein of unknown function (DUF4244)
MTLLFLLLARFAATAEAGRGPGFRHYPRPPAGKADRLLTLGRPGARPSRRDAGMSTAEYAVGTVAAVAFAGVLYAVVSSSATRSLMVSVVQRALTLPF